MYVPDYYDIPDNKGTYFKKRFYYFEYMKDNGKTNNVSFYYVSCKLHVVF